MIFSDTGLFEGAEAYEIFAPQAATYLATVIAECEATFSGSGDASLVLELGHGATLNHTQVGDSLSGAQASRVPQATWLIARAVTHKVIPAFEPATFKMRVFPTGRIQATLVRLSVARVPA